MMLLAQTVVTLLVIGAVIWAVRRSPAETNNDVSWQFYQMLQTQGFSEVFTCPTTQPSLNAEKWDFAGGANTSLNWASWNSTQGVLRNLSYQYQNPYPPEPDPMTGAYKN